MAVPYLNNRANASWNQDQQARLLVHQIQEHYELTEAPPQYCKDQSHVNVMRQKPACKDRPQLTGSLRETHHRLVLPPERDIVLES